MTALFRIPGPLGANWQPNRRVRVAVTKIVLKPVSPLRVPPGERPTFWPDSPAESAFPKPIKSVAVLSERGAKTALPVKGAPGKIPTPQAPDPPQDVVYVFPPDTPTRRYRHEGEFMVRYDLIDGDWIVTKKKNLDTEQEVKVPMPPDTDTTRFRRDGLEIRKYKLLDGNWVVTWETNLHTGQASEITPPEAITTKGRLTETGVRVSENGLPLAPRPFYHNMIAREWAAKGYINYAEIIEAGHSCMACHVTHFTGHPPTDAEIDINHYVMVSRFMQNLVTEAAVAFTAAPVMAIAESGFVMSESVVHLTSPAARSAIVGGETWGKVGGKWGIFAIDASRVPKSTLMRHVVATVETDLSAEVRISGRVLQNFRRPAPFGPFSAFKRYSGVRGTRLGSIDLVENRFIANEILVDGVFRQATQGEIMRYQFHQLLLDYGIDSLIYTGGGLVYYVNSDDNLFQNVH